MSNYLRFIAQFIDELGYVFDFYAALARRRFGDLQDGEARRHVDAEIIGRQDIHRLFLGFHDIRQLDVTRLIEA